jgi:uncharacterized membrane protein
VISLLKEVRLRGAIKKAEAGTTGRIVVRIVPEGEVDAFERAKAEFEKAEMHRHEHRNAAMILVAPKAKRFAVIGDAALHARVAPTFWDDVVAKIQPSFAAGDLAGGVEMAVASIGEQFHAHFAKEQSQ